MKFIKLTMIDMRGEKEELTVNPTTIDYLYKESDHTHLGFGSTWFVVEETIEQILEQIKGDK